ncbi:MAG TPA: cyclic nucleotide-binding domain-containing protein [Anaerolineae bacterium]
MVSPELLRRFTFFAGFSDEDLKRLAMAGREQAVSTGEVLFAEGNHADNLHFLTEGEVEILNRSGGSKKDIALSSLSAGELLGWSAVIEPHIYTASARATRPGRVIIFAGAELEKLIGNDRFCSLLMKKIAQVISQRLKDTRIQLLSLSPNAPPDANLK